MAWDIAVAGTFHRDDVTTPRGRVESFGGSAAYFALAAARYARVFVNGIAGRDARDAYQTMFAGQRIDRSGLVISSRPTFFWHVVHDFERWVTATESAEEGCDPDWVPTLLPAARDAQVLFLASMRPGLQRAVLEQSGARLIATDSMKLYIATQPAEVRSLIHASDVLLLAADELALLSGGEEWRQAARSLCGTGRLRCVVVKRGPLGASCVTASGIVEMAAEPVEEVVDPTGAGDALAGGFLGWCAMHERDDDDHFVDALREGVRCAAGAVATFGTAGLQVRLTA
jgi:sugar/nucleoside kinase (ribokinase family)